MIDKKEAKSAANMHSGEAQAALAIAQSFSVATQEHYEAAAEGLKEVKRKHTEIESTRKKFVDPLNATVKEINAFFGPALASLKETEGVLKSKIAAWLAEVEAKREQLLDQMEQAEDREQVKTQLQQTETPKVSGVSTQVRWTGEVIDVGAIPREYMIPDEKTLKAITRAKKKDPKIPGWKAYPETTVRASR